METPIGPNENVMNIVSTYYQNLYEREDKLQKITI